MSLARELIAQLQRAITAATAARDSTIAIQSQADEIIADIRAATDGSTAEKPAEAIVRLEQAKVRLDEALEEFGGGSAAIEEYIADGLGGAAASETATPARPPATSPQQRPFKPMRTDRDKVEEIRPHVGKDYAVGTLWDSDGNRILGPHSADDDGPAAIARWRAPWGEYPRLRRHIEAHAAARLKKGNTMVMYINMAPCSYANGCEENLRDIIPHGATLVIHQVHASGWTDVTAYRGTGRACSG